MSPLIQNIVLKKSKAEKIVMLTAYDYAMAAILDRSGVDIILVGDSLANVVLGLATTKEVGMDAMFSHARAVRAAVKNALVVVDMPFVSVQPDSSRALFHAKRFTEEAGCDAVKVEWFDKCPDVVRSLLAAGVPVMGHVGLTPQTAEKLGGVKVQGKAPDEAQKIIEQAKALADAGCFSVVIECVPEDLGRKITQELKVPTIGIGAGKHCDGQVLVLYDMLGLTSGKVPKFVKKYAEVSTLMTTAVQAYAREVRQGQFPDESQSFHS
ncbi:MAG: 3-methyl-2-oxobutanoate hydroxymethyltransferase [Candidatus Omnitrophica bacterium]|nr:3-methyl-2-oxobutanoate hydroxymethyltransferase [Candidatus Omnitrophota bacterium]